jgi:hypothetical protein
MDTVAMNSKEIAYAVATLLIVVVTAIYLFLDSKSRKNSATHTAVKFDKEFFEMMYDGNENDGERKSQAEILANTAHVLEKHRTLFVM